MTTVDYTQMSDDQLLSLDTPKTHQPPRPTLTRNDPIEAVSRGEQLHTTWPDPLEQEAYYGLAGGFVQTIEPHSEADPAALLAQFLVAFGNIIGRGAHFTVEADRHGLNLFTVLVGVTSRARKGTSWGHIQSRFSSVEAGWVENRIASGLSSGEGLIWSVRDAVEKAEPIREKGRVVGYQNVISDHGIKDKRLLVIEEEFASTLRVLGRDGNTLSATIRRAWDSGNLRTLTKNSPARATGAHISIIGHITAGELRRYLDATEAANGFGNRFLWVCVKRSKYLPEGGQLLAVDFAPLMKRLAASVNFASREINLQRDAEARKLWAEVYPSLSDGKLGLFGAVTSRAEAQVMRLACLYALLDQECLIQVKHVAAALAFWQYCEASAHYIFGDALGDPAADKVLKTLREFKPDGLTRTAISQIFKRHLRSQDMNRVLDFLSERGLIYRQFEETGGRKAEKWFAVDTGPAK